MMQVGKSPNNAHMVDADLNKFSHIFIETVNPKYYSLMFSATIELL